MLHLADLAQQQISARSPFATCRKVSLFLLLGKEEQSELCCDSNNDIFTCQYVRVGKQLGFQTVQNPTVFRGSHLHPSAVPRHMLKV